MNISFPCFIVALICTVTTATTRFQHGRSKRRCPYNKRALFSDDDKFLSCVNHCPRSSVRKFDYLLGYYCKKVVVPVGCVDKWCQRCAKGYLSKVTTPYKRRCVKECGSGYYQVPRSAKCHKCTSNCDVCEKGGWKCKKCNLGYTLRQAHRGTGYCWWTGCPSGYKSEYNRWTGTRVCKKKPGPRTTPALKTTTTKQPTSKMVTTDATVATTVIPTLVPDGCVDKRCFRCIRGYKRKTTFPYKNQCVKECGKGFYERKYSSICHRCHGKCEICTSGQRCIKCNVGYTWRGMSKWYGTCRWSGCPKGFIKRRDRVSWGWKCIQTVKTTSKPTPTKFPCKESTTVANKVNSTAAPLTTIISNVTTGLVKTNATKEVIQTTLASITTPENATTPQEKTDPSETNSTDKVDTTIAPITPTDEVTTKIAVINTTIPPETESVTVILTNETVVVTTPEEETLISTSAVVKKTESDTDSKTGGPKTEQTELTDRPMITVIPDVVIPTNKTVLKLLGKNLNKTGTAEITPEEKAVVGKNPVPITHPEGCLDAKCVLCKKGYAKYLPVTGVNLCVKECPVGHSVFAGICLACSDRRCASCPYSVGECDRCMKGYAMLMDATNTSVECVKRCPKSHKLVEDDDRLLCVKKPEPPCPIENCDVCVRSNLHILHVGCDRCSADFYLYRGTFKDTCRKDCPSGYFRDVRPNSNVKACNKCETPFCDKCDAANMCTKCISPFVLDNVSLKCGLCPPGTVFDFIEEKCNKPVESVTNVIEVIDEFITSNGGPIDGPGPAV